MGSTYVKNREQVGLMGERQPRQGDLCFSSRLLQEGTVGTPEVRHWAPGSFSLLGLPGHSRVFPPPHIHLLLP